MGPNATRKLKFKNMRCTILVLSLAIIYASAAPLDTMVPEDSLYEQDDDLSEAREKISQMQTAGASDKECRELTEKTKKDIQTVVTNNQNIIDKLPKGEQCMQLGQGSVVIAQTEKSKADALVVSTRTSVTKASNHKVEFGSRTYSSLTKGKCDTFFSHSNYVTAKATYKAAVTAHNKAVGAAAEATKILKIKISAAAKAKHECLCKTQKSHATEFSSRSAANAAIWRLAHKILCVLDRKTPCTFAGVPTLRRASITTAAKNEKCSGTVRANFGMKQRL